MILSCLQGHMGQVRTRGGHPPESALCAIGDFCFFAGRPDRPWCRQADPAPAGPPDRGLGPRDPGGVGPPCRPLPPAMPSVGPRRTLTGTGWPPSPPALPPGFSLSPILAGHYPLLTAQDWSRDPVRQFPGRSRLRPAWAGGHRSSGRGPRGRCLLLRRLGRRYRDPDRHPAGPAPPGAGPVLRRPADPDLPGPGAPPPPGTPTTGAPPPWRRSWATAWTAPTPPIFWTRPVRKKIARFSYGSYQTFAGKTPSKVRPPLIP